MKTTKKRRPVWVKSSANVDVENYDLSDPQREHIYAVIVGSDYGWSVGVHVESFRPHVLTKAGKPRKRSKAQARRIAEDLIRFARLRGF